MKLRYPTEKELMAALRARDSRRRVTAANTKTRSTAGAKRTAAPQEVFPVCIPYFL
jgi:hypothetical protein